MKGFNLTDRVEFLRSRTDKVTKEIQHSLVPYFYDRANIMRIKKYDFEGTRIVQQKFQLLYKINDLHYRVLENKLPLIKNRNVEYMFENNLMYPFIVFIDGKFIPWENIFLTYDYRYTYLAINMGKVVHPTDIQILHFPFPIYYSTNDEIPEGNRELFRFDKEGKLSLGGTTVLSTSNTNINYLYEYETNFYNYIVNIPDNYKLMDINIITFKEGILYRDRNLEIKPLNIITLDSGLVSEYVMLIFYDKRITYDYDIIQIPNNKTFIRDQLIAYEKDPTISNRIIPDITAEFNFSHNSQLSYKENINRSIKTICDYNTNLLGEYYASYIKTIDMTGKEVKDLCDEKGYLRMLRLKTINELDTFVIIFHNGRLYSLYKTIKYDLNSFTIRIANVEDEDILEFVYFQNVNNRVVNGIHIDEDSMVFGDYFIPSDEVIVFCQTSDELEFPNTKKTDNRWYPVDIFKNNDFMTYSREYFYGKEMTFASISQFRYFYCVAQEETFKVKLPKEFSFCPNELQYLVFVNGKKVKNEFHLVIPAETNPFYETAIYITITLKPGDRMEVFYVPMPLYDDVLKPTYNITSEVYTQNNSRNYTIPLPYPNFLKHGHKIVVTTEVESSKGVTTEITLKEGKDYTIKDNVLTLINEKIKTNKLVFDFIYLKEVGLDKVSAYIHINRLDSPIGIDKNLFFIFVNGKKVPLVKLQDISESLIKITDDIKSWEELDIIRYLTPEVDLTKEPSLWDTIANKQSIGDLNKLMNTYNTLTNTEPIVKPDLTELAIMNEIVRDYYMKPNITEGIPFLYDYDASQYKDRDAATNILIPTWNGNKFINIYDDKHPIPKEEILKEYGPQEEQEKEKWI